MGAGAACARRAWPARRPGRRPRSPATCGSMCGFPPGGTADLLCRILADAVTPEIGQKVIVDVKTGASGFIANETVANSSARRPHRGPGRDGGDVRVAGDAGPEAADQRRHRPDADRQHRRRLQHAGVRQARAVPHRAGADRAGQEEPGQASATPRPATAPRSISRASCSRRWPASISCTCPIAAARPPSRTWSPAIAT